MLLEQKQSREEQNQAEFTQVVEWLRAQADALGITIRITTDQIEERRGDYYTHILVPVRVVDGQGAYDQAKVVGELEGKWNDREPRPEKLLFLYPAGVPQHVV